MSINFPGKSMSRVIGVDPPDSETGAPSRGAPARLPGPLTPDTMTTAQSAFDERLAQGSTQTLNQRSVTVTSPSETADPLGAEPPESSDHWDLGYFQSPTLDRGLLPYEADDDKDPIFYDVIGAADPGSHERSPTATGDGSPAPGTLLSSAYDLLSLGGGSEASLQKDDSGQQPPSPNYIIDGTSPSPEPTSTEDDEMGVSVERDTSFIRSTMGFASEQLHAIISDPSRLMHYYPDFFTDRLLASFQSPPLPTPICGKALLQVVEKDLRKILADDPSSFEEAFDSWIVEVTEETFRASEVILDEIDSHYNSLESTDREAIFQGALERFKDFIDAGMSYDEARDKLADATHEVAADVLATSDQSDLSDGDTPPQQNIAPTPSPQNNHATGAVQNNQANVGQQLTPQTNMAGTTTHPTQPNDDDGMDIAPPEDGM